MRFTEQWSATGGLRLSREDRLDSLNIGSRAEPTWLAGKYESDDLSWRLDTKYAPNDDLMLYGSIATGQKSGGLNIVPEGGEVDEFQPENILAYEAGGKSRWLNGRLTLNAAAFYYDFEDLQVSIMTLAGVDKVVNAAKAQIYGIDADAACAISDRLTVSGAVVWLPMREFVEFTDGQQFVLR